MDKDTVFFGFRKNILAILLLLCGLLLYILFFGRAQAIPQERLVGEDAYEMRISTIVPFDPPIYHSYGDLEALIGAGRPNLVVRCTAVERKDATVYDPFGAYSDLVYSFTGPGSLLSAMRKAGLHTELIRGDVKDNEIPGMASAYITTPYEMMIEEVYIGDCAREGDTFDFYAPYGIIGDYSVRYDRFPFFRKGESYIMFFNVTDVEGVGRWYDLCSPPSVVRVVDDRTYETLTELSDTLFEECHWELEPLIKRIETLYRKKSYDVSVYSIQPYANISTDE